MKSLPVDGPDNSSHPGASWNAIHVPRGTPKEIIDRLNRETRAETAKWAKVVKESGAKVD